MRLDPVLQAPSSHHASSRRITFRSEHDAVEKRRRARSMQWFAARTCAVHLAFGSNLITTSAQAFWNRGGSESTSHEMPPGQNERTV